MFLFMCIEIMEAQEEQIAALKEQIGQLAQENQELKTSMTDFVEVV